MRQTAPEEAYRKLDEMAAKLTESLRKCTKEVECYLLCRHVIVNEGHTRKNPNVTDEVIVSFSTAKLLCHVARVIIFVAA
jgi:hypothetical protein